VLSMVLGGYFLGHMVPNIHKNIDKVIVVVIFLSLLPIIIKYLRERRKQDG
jgi:membrane-associated protein